MVNTIMVASAGRLVRATTALGVVTTTTRSAISDRLSVEHVRQSLTALTRVPDGARRPIARAYQRRRTSAGMCRLPARRDCTFGGHQCPPLPVTTHVRSRFSQPA